MGSVLDTPKLIDKQIDRLYSLSLEEFRAARNALAKGLRASGDPDGASRARLQERPTVAAWTVNQLARRRPQELRALFSAVDHVRAAEAAVLDGGPAEALGNALDAESSALNALLDSAQEILEERRSGGVLKDVAAILRTGAADPESRRLLKAGRLTGEPAPDPGHRHEASRDAEERIEGLQAELQDLKLAVRAAEGRVRDAEREAERAHREAEEVRVDLRRVELELAAARTDA